MIKLTQHIGFDAATALSVMFRTYCRTNVVDDETGELERESPQQALDRSINGLDVFNLLTKEQLELIRQYCYRNIVFPSGRWLWIGGTDWIEKQKNYIGAYNCASVPVVDWEAFRFNFRALLMGCGVGTVVELDKISQLPSIKYPINLVEVTELGSNWVEGNPENDNSCFTAYRIDKDTLGIIYTVGDSKEGWVDVATDILVFSSTNLSNSGIWGNFHLPENFDYKQINLSIDLSYVRPKGKQLKGFGGLSNPEKLEEGLRAVITILNKAVGKQLNSLEVCKILGIAGVITVSGNVRRSARINQGSPEDDLFTTSKDNLWVEIDGDWVIDPERDMLRMSNHSNVYHTKPTLETLVAAIRKQFYSGEGAIQYAPEAVSRANVDLLDTENKRKKFLNLYCEDRNLAKDYLQELSKNTLDERELEHRMNRLGLNPCGR